MGSIIGHRIDYNGVRALRGQQHIPSKHLPQYPPGAPLLHLPLVSPSVGLWHQETEAVRVTGTHVVLTGRTSQPLSRASLLTTVFDPWINSPPRSKEPKPLKGCACFTLPPIKMGDSRKYPYHTTDGF